MMKDFWNKRYCEKEFAYGESPNDYLKAKLSEIKVGKMLLSAKLGYPDIGNNTFLK